MPRTAKRRQASTQFWIGYCRKSTESEDRQVNSLQDQATMVGQHYARLPATERLYPLRILQEAQSAYHPGRPVFADIMRMADHGQVRGLIVVHPNRVSRNHADSGAFVQRLVEGMIPSLDTTSGKRYTGQDSNDIFMLTLEGAMSWKDSRDKGDRILQAMRMRAAEGKNMGPVRIGYRSVFQSDGKTALELVPEVAPLIQQFFELAGTGTYSLRALMAEADRIGLRSRGGKTLQLSAVHELLRDPLYKGFISFDGIVAKGRHEPIIEEPLWQRVQDILSGRRRNVGKPKDAGLRELFFFGSLIKCPACGRTLCPYRVKGKYIYYECRNPQRRCGVLVPQPVLERQLPAVLDGMTPDAGDLEKLHGWLLAQHEQQSGKQNESEQARKEEYDKVVKEMGDIFSRRQEAEALGIVDVVDSRLAELRQRRDELQGGIKPSTEEEAAWPAKAVRSFTLVELLREAIFCGSSHPREMAFKAFASNFTVEGEKLIPKLRSPFRQCAEKGVVLEWWAGLDDVRTEVCETLSLLEAALGFYRSFHAPQKA